MRHRRQSGRDEQCGNARQPKFRERRVLLANSWLGLQFNAWIERMQ